MKVLLVSPIDPDIPGKLKYLMGGENTYTRTLLSNPPGGVNYVHHLKALKTGQVKYSILQKPLSLLMKLRLLPPDAGTVSLIINDHFDLIHSHGYSLHLSNYSGRVVLSNSSPNSLFLKGYLNWGDWRIKLAYFFRLRLSKFLGIYDQIGNLQNAPLIVWSEFAKKMQADIGIDENQITVIPPGISNKISHKIKHKSFNLLFIGTWFSRKGGELLLKAYKILQNKYPKLNLTVIGEVPRNVIIDGKIIKYPYLPREKIWQDIFPGTDLLVLLPPLIEGYGLVVLEAASIGIPSLVSSVCALPEIVDHLKTGYLIKPDSFSGLTEALEFLINKPELVKKMGSQAREKFVKLYSSQVTNKRLLEVYRSVI